MQAEALKLNKPLMVVGTPGRLTELSRMGRLQTHSCPILVLDEVYLMIVLSCNLSMCPTLHALRVCNVCTHSEAVITCLLFPQSMLLITMLWVSNSICPCAANRLMEAPFGPSMHLSKWGSHDFSPVTVCSDCNGFDCILPTLPDCCHNQS